MSRTNETRHIEWHKTCKYICTLDGIICNNKQYWNEDKFRCECKKLVDKGVRNKGFIWNPSNCECQCDKSCDIGEYLDYKNGKYKERLFDKLIEKCSENIDEAKINNENENKNENENDNKHKYSFSIVYIAFFSIFFAINIGIGIYFVYQKYVNRNKYDLPY